MYSTLLALHIFAVVLWIGSIASVGILLANNGASPELRGRLARKIYKNLSSPSFGAALGFGILCFVADPSGSLVRNPNMHAKLTLAAAVIALHHWLGIHARRMSQGQMHRDAHWSITAILITCAAAAVWFVVVKPI